VLFLCVVASPLGDDISGIALISLVVEIYTEVSAIMVFASSKKTQLVNRFNLRNTFRSNEVTTSTDSSNSYADDNFSKVGLVNCNNQSSVNDQSSTKAGKSAYNFALFRAESEETLRQPSFILPIPLPYIEPVSSHDFDHVSIRNDDVTMLENFPKALYQWNGRNAQVSINKSNQESCDDNNETLQQYFVCESSSNVSQTNHDSDEEKWEYIDEMSLLHGQTVNKPSNNFISSVLHFSMPYSTSASNHTPKKVNRSFDGVIDDYHTYLMEEHNAVCHDWHERQLAFDLESVDYMNPILTEEPRWEMQPDETTLEIHPPLTNNNKRWEYRRVIESRLYCDEDFLDTDSDDAPSSSLLQQSSRSESAVLPEKQNHRKTFVRNSMKRSRTNQRTRRSCRRISLNGRRRSGRRSPPVLLGRQFSTNLATVTERPSEEDASCCIPTPRNNKLNHTNFDFSTNHSEEDTAATCNSSKDSSI
jgi:hypothetical protein